MYVDVCLHVAMDLGRCCREVVIDYLVGCWSFRSWQHIRSYSDGYQLVVVNTPGDFIVLPHNKTSTMT